MKISSFVFRVVHTIKAFFKAFINFSERVVKDWEDFSTWEKERAAK